MTTKRTKAEYYEGKITKLWDYLCFLKENKPDVFVSGSYLKNYIANQKWPGLLKKDKCPNCGATMKVDVYIPDMLDAILLMSVGEAVKANLKAGMSFTEANAVHVPSLPVSDAIRHRTTRCSYLNYLKQPLNLRQTGKWVITTWGWRALRNEPVPKKVKYFRGQMIEDSREGQITLQEMMTNHKQKVEEAIKRRKTPQTDHREWVQRYNPADWIEYDPVPVEGKLL